MKSISLKIIVVPFFCAVFLAIGTGCLSTSSFHTAQPIEAGTTEMGVALEGAKNLEEDGWAIPQPRVFARRGLTDSLDFGVTAGEFGIGADANYMVLNEGLFAMSINPYLGLLGARSFAPDDNENESDIGLFNDGDMLITTLMAGFLFDLNFTDQLTATLGVKPGIVQASEWRAGERDGETGLMLGGSLGMRIDFSSFYLFPEFNVAMIDEIGEFFFRGGIGVGF